MAAILSLPQEIIDLIVETLAIEDKLFSSVKALSLVCHTILPHCQKQLFATFSLFTYSKGRRLRTVEALWELLTLTPELGPHIRAMVYVFSINETSSELSMLPLISQKLTNLQFLHIKSKTSFDAFRWNQTPHRDVLPALLHLPTLTHLKLSDIHSFSISDLIPCIGLKDLSVAAVSFEDGPIGSSLDSLKPIALDRHSIARQGSKSFRTLWRAQRSDGTPAIDLATLKKLFIELSSDEVLQGLGEIFRNAQQLTELEVSRPAWYPRLDGLYDSFMGSLKVLKRLKFGVFISGEAKLLALDDSILALSRELGKARGRNTIESIEIVIASHDTSPLKRTDDWVALDQTLSNGGWPALMYVSLVVTVVNYGKWQEVLFLMLETRFRGLMRNSEIQFEFDIRPSDLYD